MKKITTHKLTVNKRAFWLCLLAAWPLVTGAQAPGAIRKGPLLYENTLADTGSVKGWVMEGPGALRFSGGWMEMYAPGKKWDHVLWCPRVFPSDFIAEWEVRNLKPQGLAIVFFAATGDSGQSIFAEGMPPRDGTFKYYNKGRVHCYHISYYADNPKNPDRGDSHLRKDPGAILLKTGLPGIPIGNYQAFRVRLVKSAGHISMSVNGKRILEAVDDGEAHGAVYGSGRIGFRQMRWSDMAYRNLKVWAVK